MTELDKYKKALELALNSTLNRSYCPRFATNYICDDALLSICKQPQPCRMNECWQIYFLQEAEKND